MDFKLTYVTFYSEGENGSLDLRKSQEILKNHVSPYVDQYISYSYQDVYKMNPLMVKNFHKDSPHNRGVGFCGFFRWKPFIILETLKKLENGNILIYRDCNVIKLPQYLDGASNLKDLCKFVLEKNNADIYVPIERPDLMCGQYIKKEVFQRFGEDAFNNWSNKPLLNASIIIIRKSYQSIKYLMEWLELCMDDDLVSSEYDSNIQDPMFKYSTCDQPILNMILYKYKDKGELGNNYPIYYHNNRIFNYDSILSFDDKSPIVYNPYKSNIFRFLHNRNSMKIYK